MSARHLFLVLLCFAGSSVSCSSPKPSNTSVWGLSFVAPAEWTHLDTQVHGRRISRWFPYDNNRKESISIIRVARQASLANIDIVKDRLVEAQQTLGSPRVGIAQTSSTSAHFTYASIESDFHPPTLDTSYHRAHAVVLANRDLIHIIYTAKIADADLSMFKQIVDSIEVEQ